jgi:hypothetical protein
MNWVVYCMVQLFEPGKLQHARQDCKLHNKRTRMKQKKDHNQFQLTIGARNSDVPVYLC